MKIPEYNCVFYSTPKGICINGECEEVIDNYIIPNYEGKIQLILTSPPFPLKRAKKYGNKTGEEYVNWLCHIGNKLKPLLTETGSIVIEIGNAWNSGEPTYSTLPVEALLEFKKQCGLFLCQEFIYFNPARLPGPIEWVNKKRVRVKDSFTQIWWLSKSAYPYADNNNIKEPYSKQMKKLLSSGKYNAGTRPSEHNISKTAFNVNNGGAIPSNVIIASNTSSNDPYLIACKKHGIEIHPATTACDNIVCIDDAMISGGTASRFFYDHRSEIVNKKVYYITLITTDGAIKKLYDQGITVISCIKLDDRNRMFSKESLYE